MNPDVFGPAPLSTIDKSVAWGVAHVAPFLRIARCVAPIFSLRGYWVTRYDDVREVFGNDAAFTVPYRPNADVVVGSPPAPGFVLALPDTPGYFEQIECMRAVMRADDLDRLATCARSSAAARLPSPGGALDVVDFSRQVIFDVFQQYFGVPGLPDGMLQLWVTRLFVFQLTYDGTDQSLLADAVTMAPLLQAHVDDAIANRRAASSAQPDDVIGRCLALAAAGDARLTDLMIRTIIVGCLIALPQVPMLVPNAVEQLLRRPGRLAQARAEAKAAREHDVGRYLFEAARFDPLAPALRRTATCDTIIAAGSRRQRIIPRGATVWVSFASAMRDGRRVANPERFNAERAQSDYINFGYGLHRCFGEMINHRVLPAMLRVLLERPIQRAPGPGGRLTKRSVFADRLMVTA